MEENVDMSVSSKYKFMLFVSGMSVKSTSAIENLKNICDKYIPGQFELEIIDINRNSEMAIEYQIVAIPTLIKISPAPKRIILGDLSNIKKALEILDINQ